MKKILALLLAFLIIVVFSSSGIAQQKGEVKDKPGLVQVLNEGKPNTIPGQYIIVF